MENMKFSVRPATLWERIKGRIWRWQFASTAYHRRAELRKKLDARPSRRVIITPMRYEGF